MRTIDLIHKAIAAAVVACTLVLASCAVHEWPENGGVEPVEPEPTKYPVILKLNYDTNLPLYRVIENQLKSRASIADKYDVRYTIEIYKVLDVVANTKELYSREVLTRDDVNTLNHSLLINMPEGYYEFYVWTDYVDAGTSNDTFYTTENFSSITVINYQGNNDFRDAFTGVLTSFVTPMTSELIIYNKRPLAKFNFITTDLDRFIDKMLELEAKKESSAQSEYDATPQDAPRGSQQEATAADGSSTEAQTPSRVIDISEYKVVIRYSQFMPSEFDIFSFIPVYSLPNMSFESTITPISDTEAELGFDYVFVNGDEFIIPIIVEVYDKTGQKVSGINPINIPLMRGQLTTVRDEFLTSQASGGIGINPDFEGPDLIYPVN